MDTLVIILVTAVVVGTIAYKTFRIFGKPKSNGTGGGGQLPLPLPDEEQDPKK